MENAPKATQEAFSQSQIEDLLARMGDVESPPIVSDSPGPKTEPELLLTTRHEFPQLYSFSKDQMRRLRFRHEDYVRALASRLSSHFRMECGIQMSRLESTTFQQFVDSISMPSHVTVMHLEPLDGFCLLDVPVRLGLCMVDRELGGLGRVSEELRELSKIESRLLTRVVEIAVSEWCSTWKDLLDLRPVWVANETNSGNLNLNLDRKSGLVLVVGLEVRLGGVVEQMGIGFPYRTLAPLIAKLDKESDNPHQPTVAKATRPAKWNPFFDEVKVKLTAQLPEVELTAKQLSSLQVGDVIPLGSGALNQVQVNLATLTRYVGVAGSHDRRWAVKISQVLESA